MTLDSRKLLDEVGWQILTVLQEDARLSFTEIGRRVGLSLPAVTERIRRMEEAGIITGYRVEIDIRKIGLGITAFIRVITPNEKYPALNTLLKSMPEVLESHHLAGADSFIIKVVASSIPHLESLITRLSPYGPTTTSIVLSSPVVKPTYRREAVKHETE
jgi:Lrp/AsnC family leucine-responsive transcriptional regulator